MTLLFMDLPTIKYSLCWMCWM